jgi:acetoin utilization protein AcuB
MLVAYLLLKHSSGRLKTKHKEEMLMQVKDIMTPKPITIDRDKVVYEALLLMYEHDIRRLPVVEDGRVVGIISDRDIKQIMGRPLLASAETGKEELNLSVSDVMTHDVIMVEQGADLREAIELMAENKISGLPVVDHDEKLVGVVSSIDVLWYALDLLNQVEGK